MTKGQRYNHFTGVTYVRIKISYHEHTVSMPAVEYTAYPTRVTIYSCNFYNIVNRPGANSIKIFTRVTLKMAQSVFKMATDYACVNRTF